MQIAHTVTILAEMAYQLAKVSSSLSDAMMEG